MEHCGTQDILNASSHTHRKKTRKPGHPQALPLPALSPGVSPGDWLRARTAALVLRNGPGGGGMQLLASSLCLEKW